MSRDRPPTFFNDYLELLAHCRSSEEVGDAGSDLRQVQLRFIVFPDVDPPPASSRGRWDPELQRQRAVMIRRLLIQVMCLASF